MNNMMAAILWLHKIKHRMQICLRNPRIAGSTDHVCNLPLRELNLKFKIETTFKNLCTIRDPSTHQGPPNHTAFRPIKSGETVPLKTGFAVGVAVEDPTDQGQNSYRKYGCWEGTFSAEKPTFQHLYFPSGFGLRLHIRISDWPLVQSVER